MLTNSFGFVTPATEEKYRALQIATVTNRNSKLKSNGKFVVGFYLYSYANNR